MLDWRKLDKISQARRADRLKECTTCPIKCGGGCAKRVYDMHHTFNANDDEAVCDAKRIALFEHIRNLFSIKTN